MIRRLRLKNFRCYDDQSFDFGAGLNVISGRNNVGKTTLFYAIEYCLFGRVDSYRSLIGLLNPSAKDFGVELIYLGLDNYLYSMQRCHKKPPRAKTKIDGYFTLKRAAEEGNPDDLSGVAFDHYVASSDFKQDELALALALESSAGLTRRLFDTSVHVRQGQITQILEGDRDLDRVLGVTAAITATEECRSLALEYEKRGGNAELLRANQAADSERLKAAKANLAQSHAQLKTAEATLADLPETLDQQWLEPLHDYATEQQQLAASATQIIHRVSLLEESINANQDSETLLKTTRKQQQAIDKQLDALDGEEQAAQQERESALATAGDLRARIARREALPTGDEANCESCGQAIDHTHIAKEVASWQQELTALDARLNELSVACEALAEKRTSAYGESRALQDQAADCEQQIQRQADVAELRQSVTALQSHIDHQALATQLKAAVKALPKALHAPFSAWALPDATADFGDNAAALQHCLREAQQLIAAASAKTEVQREHAEQQLVLAREQVNEFEGDISALEISLTAIAKQLDDISSTERLAISLRAMASAFKQVQTDLREQASKQLEVEALRLYREMALAPDIESLSIDSSNYAVYVKPTSLPAEVPAYIYQGGGHKLMLGLAVKFALASSLGKADFMLLDEPTYGLDVEQRRELLDRLASLGVCKQLIVISHHDIEQGVEKHLKVAREVA